MISKISNILRWTFLIFGGVFAIARYLEKQSNTDAYDDEEFQTAEFDDIW